MHSRSMNTSGWRARAKVATRLFQARLKPTAYWESFWGRRSLEEVREGFENISKPHRPWLAQRLASLEPASILEVGSGWGPNLHVLSKFLPSATLVGVDVNQFSVSEGNRLLKEEHVKGWILQAKVDSLAFIKSNSVDVVLTDALLLYVGPDTLRTVLSELCRVAKRFLVLHELHYTGRERLTRDGWLRNYGSYLPSTKTIEPVPQDLYPSGRWPEYGHLIICHVS